MWTMRGKRWLGFMAVSCVAVTLRAADPPPPAPGVSTAAPAIPVAASTAAAPATATRSPAPSGGWFIAEYVSVRSEHGIAAFAPGQAVRLVSTSKTTGKWIVTDGQLRAEVTPGQLTSDPAAAAVLRQREQGIQQAAQAALEADRLAREKGQHQYQAAREQAELRHDVEEAKREDRLQPLKPGIGGHRSIYDRPYDLKGNPYTHRHGPHGPPVGLGFKENPRADDIDPVDPSTAR